MARYIELDQEKIKRLTREAQQFQDDIVCDIGTDFMQKIAEAENKMLFDILKGLGNEPPADVVPRSEVERLEAQNEILEILVKDLRFRNKEFQKANEGLAKSIENLEIENDILREAKQEVAREIFEEIEELIELSKIAGGYADIVIKNGIAELKKKYIGKDTDVPTNIGEVTDNE